MAAQQEQIEAAAAAGGEIDPATLTFSQETYDAMTSALESAEAQLSAGETALAEAKAQLAAAQSQYEQQAASAQSQIASAQAQIDSGWSEYYEAQQQLETGESEYAQAQTEYETQLADAENEITENQAKLEDGENQYEENQGKLADARKEADEKLAEGQTEIDDAQNKIDEIETPNVYVLDRGSNYGFVSYDQNAQRMANLANMFPVIIFVVAALVCLTTMTRMVEEQRITIGGMKALGYSNASIAGKYLFYALTASVLGSMAAGCVLTLVYSLLSKTYNVLSIHVLARHYMVLLGMGAVASVLGILGDLFASAVKRQAGIKDYGTIFPGHGGILDRFDSVMFIAPFVSIAVRYFFYLL